MIGHGEIDIDSFAGGGGASTGIERALGKPVDIAVNHDAEALAMHQHNHPFTRHVNRDVWAVDPAQLARRSPIRLAWFSPDCTHHSKAKGGAPILGRKARASRDIAWVVEKWAREGRPRIIVVENVEEFISWGPLNGEGRPIEERMGETYNEWIGQIRKVGYTIQTRELRACDFGAPTLRNRLFVIARSDGAPIRWPTPTHGPGTGRAYRTAGECIDWSLAGHSIFLAADEARRARCRRPLAPTTLARIARGLEKYVLDNPEPYIVPARNAAPCKDRSQEVARFLDQYLGKTQRRTPGRDGTSTGTRGSDKLLLAHISHQYTSNTRGGNGEVKRPLKTITTGGHAAIVQAYLVKYYSGGGQLGSCDEPCPTVPTRDRIGCVYVHRVPYRIIDIGFRLWTPRELFTAQGFDPDYVIDPEYAGKRLGRTSQIRMCGNSVCPQVAEAIVRVNTEHEDSGALAA